MGWEKGMHMNDVENWNGNQKPIPALMKKMFAQCVSSVRDTWAAPNYNHVY